MGDMDGKYVLITAGARIVSGKYFEHCREKAVSALADDVSARKRLWALSEEVSGVEFTD